MNQKMQTEKLGDLLRKVKLTISTAESCTAGGVGAAVASVDGASDYYVGGAICYATRLKEELLGVSHDVIRCFGVVSKETALAMNEGIRNLTKSDIAISTTGYAGANGGDEFAENGTVWICVAANNHQPYLRKIMVENDRTTNLQEVVRTAIDMAVEYVGRLHEYKQC